MRTSRTALFVATTAVLGALVAAPAAAGPPAGAGPPADAGPPAGAGPNPAYTIDQEQVDELVSEIEDDARTVSGELAGAAYVGQVPDGWDGGRLLVWAHGYRGEGTELTVSPPPEREWLLDNGYAWIASSYRRNSYDPGIGVLDTKNVTQRAEQLFGPAETTYLAGASMGGHVTAAAIERFPTLFDGALPACGVLGDVELFDYFLDYNLGAAAFAGLKEGEFEYPSDTWIDDTVDPKIKPALSVLPTEPAWALDGAFNPLADFLDGPGETLKDFVEVGSGGARGIIYDVAWDYWHSAPPQGDFFFSLGEGPGTIANRVGVVSQNSDTDYGEEYGTFMVDEDTSLDDAIVRVEGSKRVRNAQGHKPAPIINGTPTIPVLTIHTIGDLFVPIEMEQIYAREVAANDLSDNLVQRAIRDVGHCTFSATEWQESYQALQDWVEDGIKPAGEDLVDGISSPFLGACFTVDDESVLEDDFTGVRGVFGERSDFGPLCTAPAP